MDFTFYFTIAKLIVVPEISFLGYFGHPRGQSGLSDPCNAKRDLTRRVFPNMIFEVVARE